MLLMIDNYDSFVYILKQYFEQADQDVKVYRNDAINIKQAEELAPDYLVVSPGPGTPDDAGVSMEMICHFAGKIPILGVCLGHQAIGEVFGGNIIRNKKIMHGKLSQMHHDNKGVFLDMPNPFLATRYHSLVIDPKFFPEEELVMTAKTDSGEIMGVRHKKYSIEGVQFHPESYKTENGMKMINNFLSLGV